MRRFEAIVLALMVMGGLLFSTIKAGEAFAPSTKEAEIFDVKKGAVVRRLEVTPEIRRETVKLLEAAGGEAGFFRADPTDGKVLRIPLEPGVEVRKKDYHALVTEMFIFLPDGRGPYLLLFSKESEPRIFPVNAPVERLLELCRLD